MPMFYYIENTPVELTALAVATSNIATSVYGFSMSLGTADSNRFILVPVSWQTSTTSAISSLLVAGVTATLLVFGGLSGGRAASIYMIGLPSGTTGTVTVNFDVSPANCNVATYSVSGLLAVGANGTAVSTAVSPTATLSCDEFGAMLGCAYGGAAVLPTSTWSGLTEDFDASNGVQDFSTAHENFTSAQTNLALMCSFTTAVSASGCFVSFSPP